MSRAGTKPLPRNLLSINTFHHPRAAKGEHAESAYTLIIKNLQGRAKAWGGSVIIMGRLNDTKLCVKNYIGTYLQNEGTDEKNCL